LDIFAYAAGDAETDPTVYTLKVRTTPQGEPSDFRARFTYYNSDLEYAKVDNISDYDYDYTFRYRAGVFIEYRETNNETGYQHEGTADELVRETEIRDFQWDKITELTAYPSPDADGTRHFGATARHPRDGHVVTFVFHVNGEAFNIADQTINPDAVKMDIEVSYKYLVENAKLALLSWLDAKDIDQKVKRVDDSETESQITSEAGYFAWIRSATDVAEESFEVHNSDVVDAAFEARDPPRADDHVAGEHASRVIHSFISNYRDSNEKFEFTWDPELGNSAEAGSASALVLSTSTILFAVFAHFAKRFF
jgi:hypothetical protein